MDELQHQSSKTSGLISSKFNQTENYMPSEFLENQYLAIPREVYTHNVLESKKIS